MHDHDTPITFYVGNLLGSLDLSALELGGPGSGNWAHAGRPGQIGGSQPRNSGMSIKSGKDWLERYRKAAGKEHPEEAKLREAFEKYRQKPQAQPQGNTEAVAFPSYKAEHFITNWQHTSDNPSTKAIYDMEGGPFKVNETNYYNGNIRGETKHYIVTELSKRTGIPYAEVNRIIKQWAYSSNDTDYRSLCLQEDAAEEFGVKLSAWQEKKIAATKEKTWYPQHNHVLEGYHDDPHGAARKVLREMYNMTQEQFRKLGITHVVLFRGVKNRRAKEAGKTLKWQGNTTESWTTSASVARRFAGTKGIVVAAKIPVSRILSTCRTGFGCLDELECVIFGAPQKGSGKDTVTVVKPYGAY